MTNKEKLQYLSELTVLYADDDPLLLETTGYVLQSFFKKVYLVSNGHEALHMYETKEIHIIILDNKMPLLNGLDTATQIRELDSNVPIFFASNYAEQADLLKAVKLNLVDYIIKPLSLDRLQETLFACVERLESLGYRNRQVSEGVFYDFLSKNILIGETQRSLTKLESTFFEYLLVRKGIVISNEELDDAIWKGEMTLPALRNLVARIRKKLNYDLIVNIQDIGYRIG